MAPLKGLSGLYPDPQVQGQFYDEGVLAAKANPVDTEHGSYGSQSNGYSGTVPAESPFAGMAVYDGFSSRDAAQFETMGEYSAPGRALDRTPTTHSSPYPRGIIQQSWDSPNALAVYADQNIQLHGPDLGGPRKYLGHAPAGHEEITHYTTDDYVAPNENYLSPDVPGQLRGSGSAGRGGYGGGNADPTQGYGVLNTLPEFNAGHSIRRVQHDSVHFDFTNTHGESGVPFPGRHPVANAQFDGPDSPYFEQGNIDGGLVPWEGRIGDPTAYQQPLEPAIAPTPAATDDVWAW